MLIKRLFNPLSGLNQEEKLLSHRYASGITRGKQNESQRVTLPWNYIGLYIKENPLKFSGLILAFRGEGGIRTPGGVTLNGFQDRRNRPLCHLSSEIVSAKVETIFDICKR